MERGKRKSYPKIEGTKKMELRSKVHRGGGLGRGRVKRRREDLEQQQTTKGEEVLSETGGNQGE